MSVNHKKKSVQEKNRKHQDRIAHRKKQVQSGKSEDFFHHMYSSGREGQNADSH